MATMAPTLRPVRLLWPRKRFKSVMAYLEKKAPALIQRRGFVVRDDCQLRGLMAQPVFVARKLLDAVSDRGSCSSESSG